MVKSPGRRLAFMLLCCAALSGCQRVAAPPTSPAPRAPAAYQPLPPVRNADSPIKFVNVSSKAGLHYRWTIPGKRPLSLLQTVGNGCAFFDFNHDGNLDILLIGPRLALYRGDGRGRFQDRTQETGLDAPTGRFLGCAIGDYDNDGYDDIYVSGYRAGLLLHNERGRQFVNVTPQAGLKPQPWGTSCAFADLDGDGYLDLLVVNYLQFDETSPRLCNQSGVLTACSPRTYPPLRGVVYRSVGGKGFTEVTEKWAVKMSGFGMGVACADFAESGAVGVAVANDEMDGDLFVREKMGTRFVNIALASGTATDRFGHRHGGMGIDWGDYDNDGKPDLFVTTFAHEDKCLYRNLGNGVFEERGVETGVASALEPYVSFGAKFADFDNDGFLDLIVASGHVGDNIAEANKGESYRQPLELLHNRGGPSPAFARVTKSAGLGDLPPMVGRGLAVGDYDNDGRMDALIVDSEGASVLLHNETPSSEHWVGVALTGSGGNNRDAYGAAVTIETGGRKITRLCRADGSYLSSSDARVHFGLGAATSVDKIMVRWPDGATETRAKIAADRYLDWKQ